MNHPFTRFPLLLNGIFHITTREMPEKIGKTWNFQGL